MRVLITVKAAPNPSATYGETVCVAGLRLDLDAAGWVRLYPVNFRELDSNGKFRKYDIVTLTARPNSGDPRAESWRPEIDTLRKETHLTTWDRRQRFIGEYIEGTMCGLIAAARSDGAAKSLAAIRPREVTGMDIELQRSSLTRSAPPPRTWRSSWVISRSALRASWCSERFTHLEGSCVKPEPGVARGGGAAH